MNTSDILSPALLQTLVATLTVSDLVRTAETFKQSGQIGAVENLYAGWIAAHGDDPLLYAVLFNYSVVLADGGKLEQARDCLERAIALNPDFMPAHINLGRVHERMGKIGLGILQWSTALARMAAVTGTSITHKTTALNQGARALESLNQDEAAENMLRESLELDRGQREVVQHLVALRQRQCKWPVIEPNERISRNLLVKGMSPLSMAAFTDDPLLQLGLADRYNRHDVGTPADALISWPRAMQHDGPLKIGYLSSDLREHAVGYLMTEVFGLHDRQQVEVHAYYCGPPSSDGLQEHFKQQVGHWTDISVMDDASAARQMAEDGIQILVDLNGYTREARLGVVARRPAPVIVNWLGYPGTMGSPYHHYLVADDWIIPPAHDMFYSERVLRLPCYQPSNRNRTVAERPARAQAGLPDNAFVYCCFNGSHKITRFTMDRWLRILADVPDSVLWLLGSTDAADQRLRDYAQSKGIEPSRLVFAGKLANPFHLARYPLADLFLDTTPYGAHTTASDALWMGVPVLTLSGRSFASRVCGSLVRSAGTPDMTCLDADDYVCRAIEYGRNPELLQDVRDRLGAARKDCVLFDMPLLVRELEGLYAQMWEDCRQNKLPRPDLINLDAYLETGVQPDHETTEVQLVTDYTGWWKKRLAERHRLRPLAKDKRLVTRGKLFA